MNKFTSLLLIGAVGWSCASLAYAEEDTLETQASSDITRLNYYPHAGKFYLAPDFQYALSDTGNPERNGRPGNDTSAHYLQADMTVLYGLSIPGLRVGLSESWLMSRSSDTTNINTGIVTETHSSGLSDPSFLAQYRIIDTTPKGFAWDGEFSLSPSWVRHTVATSTVDGSNGKGYGVATLSTTGYYITPRNDASAQASLSQDFSGNGVNDSNPAASFTRDAVLVFSTTLADRFRLTRDLYLQASAQFVFPYSYNQSNQAVVPVTTNYQYPFHINPTLLAGYRIRENMTMDLNFAYQNYTDTATPGTTSITDTQVVESILMLRARMEF